MQEMFKRYGVAAVIFLGIVILMLLGTLGVTQLEKTMFKDISIQPRGEKLN